MKRVVILILIFSLLLHLGCSSITQIPYPVEQNKSENEIRQLNYFGERLNSKITLTNSIEIETYWLRMEDNKIYFLTEGLEDTTSVAIDKIKKIRFYDMYGGCVKGGLLGLGFFVLPTVAFGLSGSQTSSNEYDALTALFAFAGSIGIGIISGILFFGNREFNFVQTKE